MRTELPNWEAAIRRFEATSRTPLTDTLKIGFLRKNLGSTIRNQLRLNAHLLEDYNQARELIIEWNRFDDFDAARHNQHGPRDMDIGALGWYGQGKGKTTT